MILIFSVFSDYTTTRVCQWLSHNEQQFIRINGDLQKSIFSSMFTKNGSIIFHHNGEDIDLREITTVWYRKCGLGFSNFNINYRVSDEDFFYETGESLYHLVKNEVTTLSQFIHNSLEKKRNLGKKFNANLNKLVVLEKARELDINVPDSYILTKRDELESILKAEGDLITKALKDGIYKFNPKHAYYSYTEKVSLSNIDNYPAFFAPTLFQPLIDKEFELRIFFIDGEFYSMAIFSQDNEVTKVDSRRGSIETGGRRIPYLLPKDLEKKLTALMHDLDLNTGSIDIIVTQSGEFVFLEVNPVGQFSMVSDPCNYYLETKVAHFLCQ